MKKMFYVVGILLGICFKLSKAVTMNGRLGEDIKLPCGVSASGSIWWQKYVTINDGGIFIDLTPDANKYKGIDQVIMTIKQLTLNDAGFYRCAINATLVGTTIEVSVTNDVVDGNWGSWTSWSSCSVTCGSQQGTTYRTRLCNDPSPANGGADCGTDNSEAQTCFASNNCPAVNGNWGLWTPWSSCSVTCGGQGISSRTRQCDNPAPSHGGADCGTYSYETQTCFASNNCPVNGNWGSWTSTSTCSVSCGNGVMSRSRLCNNPPPAFGGLSCSGSSTDTVTCSAGSCPINGNWGLWTTWNICTTTCGDGTKSRTRTCDNPSPSDDGADCVGSNVDSVFCSSDPCPVDGGWGVWLEWSLCTAACGEGNRTRNRTCDNPPPAYIGKPCDGSNQATETCTVKMCPNEEEQQKSSVVPTAVGSVLGILVLVLVIVGAFIFLRRNTGEGKGKAYESHTWDANKEQDHVYSSAQRIYINTEISMDRRVPPTPNAQTQSLAEYLLIPYTSSDLAERFKNQNEHCLRREAEIKYLSQIEQGAGDYELDDTVDLTLGVPLLKESNSYSMIIQLSEHRDGAKFWKLVKENGIANMFLLLKRNEKVADLMPTFEESLTYDGLTVDLESNEKLGTKTVFSVVKVKQTGDQDDRIIKIYKTITNERVQPKLACNVIDTIVGTEDDRLLFVFSKSTTITNISTLAICYNGIRKIKMGEAFNLLNDAESIKTPHHDWFNEKEDLQYCYDVLRQYLESFHTYDIIL